MSTPMPPMGLQSPAVSLKELWMLLGEKDVQIYQLLMTVEMLGAQIKAMEEVIRGTDGNPDGVVRPPTGPGGGVPQTGEQRTGEGPPAGIPHV